MEWVIATGNANHYWPWGDTRQHEMTGADCWCEPSIERVEVDGEELILYQHHHSRTFSNG